MNDLTFALRQLRKAPGFTIVAVATLALGIMAVTAMYSVLYAVVLDPFPYRDVDRLMSVSSSLSGGGYYSTDQFVELAKRNTVFEGTIASTISDVFWTGEGDPQRLRGNIGTYNTFQVMGVPPLIGRIYGPADSSPESPAVVVLGYRFWQRQFGGATNVLGRQLRLNGRIRTVVGVMPKRFMWRGADVYLPIILDHGRSEEGVQWVHLLGRLKPGVTRAQAEADLRPILLDLKKQEPSASSEPMQVRLLSFKETFPSDIRNNLWILFCSVGLLLLIACANVSNLLLSKAGARQREMAIRASLGASRARLIRQLLVESLVLAGVGGVLGVGLAYGSVQAVLSLVPPGTIPDESEICLNTPVMLFALAVSVITSVVFGLAPALHACVSDLAHSLREGGRGLSGSSRQALLRNGLVVCEVALSLILLVGAGLMIRTFQALESINPGFRTDRLLAMRIPFSDTRYPSAERKIAFLDQLEERVRALPGVAAVGFNTQALPMWGWALPMKVVGSPVDDGRRVSLQQVNAGYANAFGIKVLQGRFIDSIDVSGKRRVAVVNETFAKLKLGSESPLGHIVEFPSGKDMTFEIVGVVKDTVRFDSSRQRMPEMYVPFSVLGVADWMVTLTQEEPASMTRAVLSQVYGLDKEQPVTQVQTIQKVMDDEVYAAPKFNLALFSVFGLLGLTLAAIGIYGVMSNTVAQQTHEIGVRMAIGASPREVGKMVLKRGARLLFLGVGVGAIGGVIAAHLMIRLIWNVSPFDPVGFVVVALVLVVVGVLACAWPAFRASRIHPIEALRYE